MQSATVDLVEAKRSETNLSYNALAGALAMTREGLRYAMQHPSAHLQLSTCGRVAQWLNVPIDVVLRSEGMWDKLTPLGQMLMCALARTGISERQLAVRSDVCENTVRFSLDGRQQPNSKILDRWATLLSVDRLDLHRAARESKRQRQTPASIRRFIKKHGHDALRVRGTRLYARLVVRQTKEQRLANSRAGGAKVSERWATATIDERRLWGLAHITPNPKGTFGICRVCQKLTFIPSITRRNQRTEYHGKCLAGWRASSPEWAEWNTAREHGASINGWVPRPNYPPGRRPSPSDLADYYETAVRLLRVRLRASGVRGRRPHDPADQLVNLHLTRQGRHARISRLIDLLPAEEVCSGTLLRMVRAIKVLDAFEDAA